MPFLLCFWRFSGLRVHVGVHVENRENRKMLKYKWLGISGRLLWEQEAAGSNPVTPICWLHRKHVWDGIL